MLIGFIVVIVMILVIVGLMATGNSGGGTGVNQTKATKVVTEIGTLAQSVSFYKTTTAAGDLAGLTSQKAIDLLGNSYSADATGYTDKADLDIDGNTSTVIPTTTSQADSSVKYAFTISHDSNSDGTYNDPDTSKLRINVLLGGTDADLVNVVGDTIVSKLGGGAADGSVSVGNMSVQTAAQGTAGTWAAGDILAVVVQ